MSRAAVLALSLVASCATSEDPPAIAALPTTPTSCESPSGGEVNGRLVVDGVELTFGDQLVFDHHPAGSDNPAGFSLEGGAPGTLVIWMPNVRSSMPPVGEYAAWTIQVTDVASSRDTRVIVDESDWPTCFAGRFEAIMEAGVLAGRFHGP